MKKKPGTLESFKGLLRIIDSQLVVGVMDTTRALLPHFRANGSGIIINLSDGAGIFTFPLLSIYSASKFALEGFMEALLHELGSLNIVVKNVIPTGPIASTNFVEPANFGTTMKDAGLKKAYGRFFQKIMGIFRVMTAHHQITGVGDVANVIYAAATDGTAKFRYVVGNDEGGYLKAKHESVTDEEYVTTMGYCFNS